MPQRPITGRERVPATTEPRRNNNGHGGARRGAGNHHQIGGDWTVHSLKNEVLTLRRKYGVMPLDHMLKALNAEEPSQVNGEDRVHYLDRLARFEARKDWAAEKAAPYLHHKLSSVEITKGDQPVQQYEIDYSKLSVDELKQLHALATKARKSATMDLDDSQYHEVE